MSSGSFQARRPTGEAGRGGAGAAPLPAHATRCIADIPSRFGSILSADAPAATSAASVPTSRWRTAAQRLPTVRAPRARQRGAARGRHSHAHSGGAVQTCAAPLTPGLRMLRILPAPRTRSVAAAGRRRERSSAVSPRHTISAPAALRGIRPWPLSITYRRGASPTRVLRPHIPPRIATLGRGWVACTPRGPPKARAACWGVAQHLLSCNSGCPRSLARPSCISRGPQSMF